MFTVLVPGRLWFQAHSLADPQMIGFVVAGKESSAWQQRRDVNLRSSPQRLMEQFGLQSEYRSAGSALATAQIRLQMIRQTRVTELAAMLNAASRASEQSCNEEPIAGCYSRLLAKLDRYERVAQAQRDRALEVLQFLSATERLD